MTDTWWKDPWVEDLASWEELTAVLHEDWDRVEHAALGLSLERADGLLAFDLRAQWRARHRRGLHRLGFRRLALPRIDVWLWAVDPQLRATDLSRYEPVHGTERYRAAVLSLRTSLARDQLVREQALRVLREVFRCDPPDLSVLLVPEDQGWEDGIL